MKKNIFLPFLLLTSLFIFWMPKAVFAQDPVAMLNGIANQMIEHLKADKATLKTDPSRVYSLAYKFVVPHADLEYMSKRVLPAQTWQKASPAERSAFKKEFATLLVRTYASALADYSDQTVQFYPVRGASGATVTVRSQIIRSDGPSIPVVYSLVSQGSNWKLFDMSVEGVSMLQSFRSQFADNLSHGNISDLIQVLKNHNSAHGA